MPGGVAGSGSDPASYPMWGAIAGRNQKTGGVQPRARFFTHYSATEFACGCGVFLISSRVAACEHAVTSPPRVRTRVRRL